MFNVGAGEIVFILIAALLVLGPKRLPELARAIGKFLAEFRRQTDEVRTVVEREFYRMDQELDPLPKLTPPEGTRPSTTPGLAPPPEAAPAPAEAAGTPPAHALPAAPPPPAGPATPAAGPAGALEPSLATTQPMAPVTPEEVAQASGRKPS